MSTQNVRVTGSNVEALEGVSEFERRLVERINENVMDPHIDASVVEMGMVYDVIDEEGDVTVEMTFPCMGCPAYGMIQDDVEETLLDVAGVEDVTIDVVWDPVWSKDRLDEDTRQKLRESGTAI